MKLKSVFGAVVSAAVATLSLSVAGPATAANNCGNLQISPVHSSTFYIDTASGFDANYIGYSIKNNGGTAVTGKSLNVNSLTGGTLTLDAGESTSRALPSIAAGATVYEYFFAKSSATGDVTSTTTISLSLKTGSTVNCTVSDSLTEVDDVLDTQASTIDSVALNPASGDIYDGDTIEVIVSGDSGNIGNGTGTDPEAFIFAPVVKSANFDPAHYRLIGFTHNGCSTLNLDNMLRNINTAPDCDNSYITTYTFKAFATQTQTVASSIDGQTYVASGAQIKHPGVVTAKTLPLVKAKNKVTYDANGGSGSVASQSFVDSVLARANGFTWECHTFIRWNVREDGTGDFYAPNDSYSETGTTVLYAEWEEDPNCTPSELAATGTNIPVSGFLAAAALVALGVTLRRKQA